MKEKNKKVMSICINKNVCDNFRHWCARNDKTISQVLENCMVDVVEKGTGNTERRKTLIREMYDKLIEIKRMDDITMKVI